MNDIGLTHIALPVRDVDSSISFYAKYAKSQVVHTRADAESGKRVVWLSDRTRPFVLVLIEEHGEISPLRPNAHLGVGCASRSEVDELCDEARKENILIMGPTDSGYPVGYWALIRDPDGHTLEIAYGQEVALTVNEAGLSSSGSDE
jgi:catechol 2,3-dioxygenase-like lactoylglutathione lyase family enzyme